METTSTYETYNTAAIQRNTSKIACTSIFRSRLYSPSLVDWTDSRSMSSGSSSYASHENGTAFLPWDERHHRTIVRRHHQSAAATSSHWCTSKSCIACRQAATPRFVPVRRSTPTPTAPKKWWESPTLTTVLADRLGEWVETKLMRACDAADPFHYYGNSNNSPDSQFCDDMEDDQTDGDEEVDDTSLVPYDEKAEDPRYASF